MKTLYGIKKIVAIIVTVSLSCFFIPFNNIASAAEVVEAAKPSEAQAFSTTQESSSNGFIYSFFGSAFLGLADELNKSITSEDIADSKLVVSHNDIIEQLPAETKAAVKQLEHKVAAHEEAFKEARESLLKAQAFRFLNDIITGTGESLVMDVIRPGFRTANALSDYTLTVQGLPEGASFSNGTLHWTPSQGQAGSFPLQFLISDEQNNQQSLALVVDVLSCSGAENPAAYSREDDTLRTKEVNSGVLNSTARTHIEKTKTSRETKSAKERMSLSEYTNDDTTGGSSDSNVGYIVGTVPFYGATGNSSKNNSNGNNGNNNNNGNNGNNQNNGSSGNNSDNSGNTNEDNTEQPADDTDDDVVQPDLTIAPTTPELEKIHSTGSFNGTYRIEWSDESWSGATIYELQESLDPDFIIMNNSFFPSGNYEDFTDKPSGHYYYRVRSWNAPQELGGKASDFSNTILLTVDRERDINVLDFPQIGYFSEIPGAPGTGYQMVTDADAYSNPVVKFDYDLNQGGFAGLYFKDSIGINIATMNTLNIRLRGDEQAGYPIRMVIELKCQSEIQGVLFVTNITSEYQDIPLAPYIKSSFIDEVTVFVEDESNYDGVGSFYIDELFFSSQPFAADIEPEILQSAGPGITDAALIDKVEAESALYFFNETVGAGHVKDTTETNYSSIAATGFGLSALTIMAKRYNSSQYWTVSPSVARTRVLNILRDLERIQNNQTLNPAEYGTHGFFYHFLAPDGKRQGDSELSIVDTAILIAGVLTAGEYFGGEVKTIADTIYANIDWTYVIDENSVQYYMGWKPALERKFTVPAKDGIGYYSNATFNKPTDEILLVTILALGNHIDNPLVRNSYFSYPRESKQYVAQSGDNEGEAYNVVNSYFGSLFTYVFAHCFFDFKTLGDDNTWFAPSAPYPVSVDWWENSVQAVKANRQFCIDRREYYPFSFNENSWGLSAVQRPDGRYEGRYGAVPFDNGAGHDGVVALYGPLSSMPFFKSYNGEEPADNTAFQSLRYFYDNFYDNVYGEYGFFDSYDNEGNFSNVYLGIDQGPIVLMIENYRDGFVWETLAQNEKLSEVVDLLFVDSFNFLDVAVRNISDNEVATGLDFGVIDADTTVDITPTQQYVEIVYNLQNPNVSMAIYTDNQNNTVPYTGVDEGAGMVGVDDATYVAPLYWVVYDELQGQAYTFNGDEQTEGKIQDRNRIDFTEENVINSRTIVDGDGNLAPYPVEGRITTSSTVYVYAGCDFNGLLPQQYGTDTLTIEVFTAA